MNSIRHRPIEFGRTETSFLIVVLKLRTGREWRAGTVEHQLAALALMAACSLDLSHWKKLTYQTSGTCQTQSCVLLPILRTDFAVALLLPSDQNSLLKQSYFLQIDGARETSLHLILRGHETSGMCQTQRFVLLLILRTDFAITLSLSRDQNSRFWSRATLFRMGRGDYISADHAGCYVNWFLHVFYCETRSSWNI